MKIIIIIAAISLLLLAPVLIVRGDENQRFYVIPVTVINGSSEDYYGPVSFDLNTKELIDSGYLNTDISNFIVRDVFNSNESFSIMPGSSSSKVGFAYERNTSTGDAVDIDLTASSFDFPELNKVNVSLAIGAAKKYNTIVVNIDSKNVENNPLDPAVGLIVASVEYYDVTNGRWQRISTNLGENTTTWEATGKKVIILQPTELEYDAFERGWVTPATLEGFSGYWIRINFNRDRSVDGHYFTISSIENEPSSWWINISIPASSQKFLELFLPYERDNVRDTDLNHAIFHSAATPPMIEADHTPYLFLIKGEFDSQGCRDKGQIVFNITDNRNNIYSVSCDKITTRSSSSSLTESPVLGLIEDQEVNSIYFVVYNSFTALVSRPGAAFSNSGALDTTRDKRLVFPSITGCSLLDCRNSVVKSLHDLRYYPNYTKGRVYTNVVIPNAAALGTDDILLNWNADEVALVNLWVNPVDPVLKIVSGQSSGTALFRYSDTNLSFPSDLSSSVFNYKQRNDVGGIKIEIRRSGKDTRWIDITDGSAGIELESGNKDVFIRLTLFLESGESPEIDSFFIFVLGNSGYYSPKFKGGFKGVFKTTDGSTGNLGSFNLAIPESNSDVFATTGDLFIYNQSIASGVDRIGGIKIEGIKTDPSKLNNLPFSGQIFKLHLKSSLPIPVVWSLLFMFFVLIMSFFTVKYLGETILFVVILLMMMFAALLSNQIVGIQELMLFLIVGLSLILSNQEVIR